MLTGTPLDLTPFGVLPQGIGLLYWLVVIAVLALVLTKIKNRTRKLLAAVAVLAILVGPVMHHVWKKHEQRQQAKARLDAAMVRFEMRCKSAGEKIAKTVDDVEGIVWMKWRSKETNRKDQFALDDPYGHDCEAEGCIFQLLRPTAGTDQFPEAAKRHANGYRFIETIDPRDGKRYRYTASLKAVNKASKEEFSHHVESTGFGAEIDGSFLALSRQPIDEFTARYGITWDDVSTREDREYWIAGGSLKVIDLQTNDVIAERTGFLIDPGQGSTAGFRDPWGWAKSYSKPCPPTSNKTWTFATKIAQPIK